MDGAGVRAVEFESHHVVSRLDQRVRQVIEPSSCGPEAPEVSLGDMRTPGELLPDGQLDGRCPHRCLVPRRGGSWLHA